MYSHHPLHFSLHSFFINHKLLLLLTFAVSIFQSRGLLEQWKTFSKKASHWGYPALIFLILQSSNRERNGSQYLWTFCNPIPPSWPAKSKKKKSPSFFSRHSSPLPPNNFSPPHPIFSTSHQVQCSSTSPLFRLNQNNPHQFITQKKDISTRQQKLKNSPKTTRRMTVGSSFVRPHWSLATNKSFSFVHLISAFVTCLQLRSIFLPQPTARRRVQQPAHPSHSLTPPRPHTTAQQSPLWSQKGAYISNKQQQRARGIMPMYFCCLLLSLIDACVVFHVHFPLKDVYKILAQSKRDMWMRCWALLFDYGEEGGDDMLIAMIMMNDDATASPCMVLQKKRVTLYTCIYIWKLWCVYCVCVNMDEV